GPFVVLTTCSVLIATRFCINITQDRRSHVVDKRLFLWCQRLLDHFALFLSPLDRKCACVVAPAMHQLAIAQHLRFHAPFPALQQPAAVGVMVRASTFPERLRCPWLRGANGVLA